MSKARLSQTAANWVGEDREVRKKTKKKKKGKKLGRKRKDLPKKKQTFSLLLETVKRLWVHRVKTGKTISEIMDKLVDRHLPKYGFGKRF